MTGASSETRGESKENLSVFISEGRVDCMNIAEYKQLKKDERVRYAKSLKRSKLLYENAGVVAKKKNDQR